jgi:post-segregation antitoxin (ccd killing protein)
MRIIYACRFSEEKPVSTPAVTSSRKRAVNLTLSEGLVEQARAYTDNLSAVEEGKSVTLARVNVSLPL